MSQTTPSSQAIQLAKTHGTLSGVRVRRRVLEAPSRRVNPQSTEEIGLHPRTARLSQTDRLHSWELLVCTLWQESRVLLSGSAGRYNL